MNSFVPKPWTPFQYHPYGLSGGLEADDSVSGTAAVKGLRAKISVLKKGLKEMPNTRVKATVMPMVNAAVSGIGSLPAAASASRYTGSSAGLRMGRS